MAIALFIVLFVAFAAFIVWGIRKGGQIQEKRNDQYDLLAREHDWEFIANPNANGDVVGTGHKAVEYSFEGRVKNVPWCMWYDTGQRYHGAASNEITEDNAFSPGNTFAVWACEGIRAREVSVLILPRWQYKLRLNRAFDAFLTTLRFIATRDGGADASESWQAFVNHSSEWQGTSQRFRDEYAVLIGRNVSHEWLNADIENLMLGIPKPLHPNKLIMTVSLSATGMHIQFSAPNQMQWDFWEKFGQLGEALASRFVESGVARS